MEKIKGIIHRPRIKNVAFFGDANISANDPTYKEAFDVAKLLASNAYTIVNGGGPGVMDASTHGAEEVQGETLSVTFYPADAPGFEGRYLGNVTDKEIKTQNYIERMFKLMEHADIYVIFKGGSGTMSEFGTAWVLAKIYYGHHKPFILYGDFWREVIGVLKKHMNIDQEELDVFRIVNSRGDVLAAIRHYEHKINKIEYSKDCKFCLDGKA